MSVAPRIRVHNKFNSGLYGEVWVGEQPLLANRKVAVKVIKVEMADRATAIEHAQSLALLNHPNIVTVYSLENDVELPGVHNKVDALVMEWLEGQTLGQLIIKGGISPEDVFRTTEACIEAVRYMHSRGVFHGDLNPGNVIVGGSFVKIIDISVADQRSMSRYSTISKAILASVDVGYIAGNLRICLNRCTADYGPLHEEIEKLSLVKTLEDVEAIVNVIKEFDAEACEDDEVDEADDVARELDDLVLKACGDITVKGRFIGEIVSTPKVVEQLAAEGVSSEDVLDAFEILGEQGFFREGDARFRRFVQLSNFGMDTYLRSYYQDYEKAFRAVKIAVVRDAIMNDRMISANLGRELPVVQHFLIQLKNDYGCTVSSSNMGYEVVEIGARLRREMKGVTNQ